jgi:6-phosphogluconolactonase
MQPNIHRFASAQALAASVCELVTDAVTTGIAARNFATLVFSGGRTPEFFLPQLAQLDLDWARVYVTLADERWVDESSPHSNTAMLKRTLLQGKAAKASFIPLTNSASSAEQGVNLARSGLHSADTPYDLVLLGMGNDGHFASLFPGTPDLARKLAADNTERVVAVPAPTTAAPHVERISMTLAELSRSPRIKLILQGDEKLKVLDTAFAGNDAMQTPVVALGGLSRQLNKPIDVMWCP